MKNKKQTVFSLIKTGIDDFLSDEAENIPANIEKYDENLSPNMRALRLSIGIADVLLSRGVRVSEVVNAALDVTDRYCKRKVQFDCIFNYITVSQDRGNEREPLTLTRVTTRRRTNNMLIRQVSILVDDISRGKLTLDEAEARFDAVMESYRKYPLLVISFGSACIGAGIGILFSGSLMVTLTTFLIAGAVSYGMATLAKQSVPVFFAQILAAFLITCVAGFVYWLGLSGYIEAFHGLDPTLIVIGGIVMLVAGLAIVGAVQDAIDGFYVTANARLLQVAMLTVAIVIGVVSGLYVAKEMGIYIPISTSTPPLRDVIWQYGGAAIIAAGYALSMQTAMLGILLAGLVGFTGRFVFLVAEYIELSPIVAVGLASIAVGFLATWLTRIWRMPSIVLVTAGIIQFVPGLALYNGLLMLVGSPESSIAISQAIGTLLDAFLIALAITAGASFGSSASSPLRLSFVHARNSIRRSVRR